ncbi:S9 family peptidase [Motilimonas eburnea]|uniref:S9 family peptidase n=1 Tax=Motilimonas eburnea TaxID=1737488 RepID=UPI001E436DF6|nr:S9 family peptidase [Motilimonas eburnea]MCE2570267.1 S9 family peptidase [Motilimonas eburnea]
MIKLLTLFFACLLLTGCNTTTNATHPTLKTQKLPQPVSWSELQSSTNNTYNYRISPDGTKLAWIGKKYVRGDWMHTIHYRDINGSTITSMDVPAWGFEWLPDSKRVYASLSYHNEDSVLLLYDLSRPDAWPKQLFDHQNVRMQVESTLANAPNHILISYNHRDPEVFDLFRLNLQNKEATRLYKNATKVSQWIIDESVPEGDAFAMLIRGKNGNQVVATKTGEVLYQGGKGEFINHVVYDHKQQRLIILSDHQSDKQLLFALDLTSKQIQVLAQDSQVDIHTYVYDENKKPVYAVSYPDYQRVHVLDERYQSVLDQYQTDKTKSVRVISSDTKEQALIVEVTDSVSYQVYLYEPKTQRSTLLESSSTTEITNQLSQQKPIQFTSSDGLIIHGYLTTPANIPARNLPTVLLVHGGPHARDFYGFDPQVQLLANRGYAVLQVNYRGSVGYGRDFLSAGFGEFSLKMHQDLIDGVDWAIAKGITDPDHVAIVGASYGGYATLVGLTKTPDKFACGVDIFGISDLELFINSVPQVWTLGMDIWRSFVGDVNDPKDLEKMRQASPIYFIDKINKPLLVIQGTEDVRVTKEQSRNMVEKMRQLNKPVEYWEMDGVGHNFGDLQNQRRLTSKVDEFLATCLGGRG